jgi:hypothetical protein
VNAHTSRRTFLAAGGTLAAASVLTPHAAQAQPAASPDTRPMPPSDGSPRIDYHMPTLVFGDADRQNLFGKQYEAALTNVIGINTVYPPPDRYDSSGLIAYPPGKFAEAGQAYTPPQRWTRDNAVNAWNAINLIGPIVGANTLWAATDRQADGSLILLQDTQWWDHIIWVVSAWNQYVITGDRDFLGNAYQASVNSLAARKSQNFNADYGLFMGPGFMNDGIAGYPSPPAAAVDAPGSGFVLSYPHANEMMVLSTNCEYYGAYQALAGMADELGRHEDAASYRRGGAALRAAINRHLWRSDAGIYGYFVHGNDALAGQLDPSQEGGGLAFAILLGVTDARQTKQVLDNTHWQPHGIVNVWPSFPRFSEDKPGRHNVIVWPMVHSMYGHAAAVGGRVDLFDRAVTDLANLAAGSDNSFYELYNSVSGAVDGGWQVGRQWTSQPNQTWSATGYLRMIYYGLFGLTFSPDRLTFAPTLPPGWGPVSLYGVPYRDTTLDIELTGAGNRVRSSTIDGRAARAIPATATGNHTVRITLGD